MDEGQLAFLTNANSQSATTTALPASATGTHVISWIFGMLNNGHSFSYGHTHDRHRRTKPPATSCYFHSEYRIATRISLPV